ncbi:SDR family NAD(P)-dependent oxidoreductase [Paenibacillus rhizoplanae]
MNKSKIVLITGGNKGIGFETARQLGNMGYEILIGARSENKGHEAVTLLEKEKIKAKTVVLDVTNPSSVLSAVEWIEQEYGLLDILINNAGVFFEENTPPSELELSVLKSTYETKRFSVYFSVTKAMLPLLRNSSAGRIVNLSSALGSLTLNSDSTSEFL